MKHLLRSSVPSVSVALCIGVLVPALMMPKTSFAAPELIPHRAVYDVTLAKTSQTDGVRGARGTMVFSIADQCDGYTLEQAMDMDMTFTNGVFNAIDQRYAAWESKDARSSTFRMEVIENGQLSRSHRGRIDLEEDGSGEIVLESDGTTRLELPKGTMLSTQHLKTILEKAETGDKFFSTPMIDGTFDDGAYQVTAVIGPARPETAGLSDKDIHEIGRGSYWPVGVAYFHYASSQELPDYEVSIHLAKGGVAQSMLQDFGDFSLKFELLYIEPLEAVACDKPPLED